MLVSVPAMAAEMLASMPILFCGLDAHLGAEVAVEVLLPGHRLPFLGMLVVILDIAAGVAVDDDAAARRQERDDRIIRESGGSSARR